MSTVVVLTSGGIDSCVLASMAAQNNQLALLHIDYRQQARQQERKAFDQMVRHYQPKHSLVVEMDYLKQIGGCGLVDPRYAIENPTDFSNQLPRTYLPFGFPAFWSIAAGWAQTINAQTIYFGGSEDYNLKVPAYGKIEPSLDHEVVQSFNYMLQKVAPLGQKIALELPLLNMSRMEILYLARQLQTPLELTWSCYRAGPNPCKECYRCVARQQSFKAANMPDPFKE
ncbi:MAG: 7-cyano-7-deazaguanine synthase [Phycisphaerae bacterium]